LLLICDGDAAVPQSHFFGLRASSKIWRGESRSITAGNMAQASTAASLLEWVKKDKRRMLHVVYRVGDLDRTIKYVLCFYLISLFLLMMMMSKQPSHGADCRFYTECLGMKLLRKRDIPEERYANAFLGYGPEDSHFVIELTYSK